MTAFSVWAPRPSTVELVVVDDGTRTVHPMIQEADGWWRPVTDVAWHAGIDYGFLLDGVKSFSSGSVGSDWLTISAWHAETQSALIGVVPTRQHGVTVAFEGLDGRSRALHTRLSGRLGS